MPRTDAEFPRCTATESLNQEVGGSYFPSYTLQSLAKLPHKTHSLVPKTPDVSVAIGVKLCMELRCAYLVSVLSSA